jgi:hypothetical protein
VNNCVLSGLVFIRFSAKFVAIFIMGLKQS